MYSAPILPMFVSRMAGADTFQFTPDFSGAVWILWRRHQMREGGFCLINVIKPGNIDRSVHTGALISVFTGDLSVTSQSLS